MINDEPLDKEVISTVEFLNKQKGVRTHYSCSGHGESRGAYIALTVSNWDSLIRIIKAVYRIRYEAGNNMDLEKHMWDIVITPQNQTLLSPKEGVM